MERKSALSPQISSAESRTISQQTPCQSRNHQPGDTESCHPQLEAQRQAQNLQRRDLDYIEEAEGLARLMRLYGLSQEQAAIRIGRSQSAVANKLRLLRHTQRVRDALREHHLTERHARALLRLPGETARLEAIDVIARRGLTVAATEEYIDSLLKARAAPARKPPELGTLLSAIDQSLSRLRTAGYKPDTSRREDDSELVLTIRIPKMDN